MFENTRHTMAFLGSDGIGKVGLFCLQVLEFQVVKVLCKQNAVLELCSFFLLVFKCLSYDTTKSCAPIRFDGPPFVYFRRHSCYRHVGIFNQHCLRVPEIVFLYFYNLSFNFVTLFH